MYTILQCGFVSAALATVLAVFALIATRCWRNPYAARVIWLVVLLRFIVPPLYTIEMPWRISAFDSLSSSNQLNGDVLSDSMRAPTTAVELKDLSTYRSRVANGEVMSAMPTSKCSFHADKVIDLAGSLDLIHIVCAIWIAGALWMASVFTCRIWKFHSLVRDLQVISGDLAQRANSIAAQIGLSKTPRICLANGKLSPLVWCFGKQSTIVLPANLMKQLDHSKATAVLAHEIMHIYRRDSWVRYLELLVVCLYWWCPFAWIARSMGQDAEERSCDADVLQRFPHLRKSYANALLETLDSVTDQNCLALATTSFVKSNALKRRFEMIVNPREQVRPSISIQVSMLLIASCLLSTALAPSSSASSSKPRESSFWEVTLDECLSIALKNYDEIQLNTNSQMNDVELREPLENMIRDIDSTYWSLWLARRNFESAQAAQKSALKTWRIAKAYVPKVGLMSDEARARGQYFLYHSDAEKFRTETKRVEHRLRYLLGISASDGRIIDPISIPRNARNTFEMEVSKREAFTNRVECLRQQLIVAHRKEELEAACGFYSDSNHSSEKAASAKLRHLELLLARELAVQAAIEAEVAHQLRDAMKNIDLCFLEVEANRSRLEAVQKERTAVQVVFDSGRVELDQLLEVQRKEVETGRMLNQSRVDNAGAISRVHYRKGTLLSRYSFAAQSR